METPFEKDLPGNELAPKRKKVWDRPTVVQLGPLAELTQFGGFTTTSDAVNCGGVSCGSVP